MADVSGLQMPVKNQEVADNMAAAQQAQISQNQAQLNPQQAMAAGPAAAQAVGAQRAAVQGNQALAKKAIEGQREVQSSQQQLFNQKILNDERNRANKMQLEKRHATQMQDLASKGRDIKEELIDREMQLNQTERGLSIATNRQMYDLMHKQQMDEHAFTEYEQGVNQALQLEELAIEESFNTIRNTMDHVSKVGTFREREKANEVIRQAKVAYEKKKAELAKKKGRMNMMKGLGMAAVGGGMAYVGVTTGNPMLAQAGAATAAAGASQATGQNISTSDVQAGIDKGVELSNS